MLGTDPWKESLPSPVGIYNHTLHGLSPCPLARVTAGETTADPQSQDSNMSKGGARLAGNMGTLGPFPTFDPSPSAHRLVLATAGSYLRLREPPASSPPTSRKVL